MFFPFRRKSPRFFGLFSFARLSLERCFRRGCTLLAVWTSAMPSPRPIRRHIAGFSSTIRPPQERIGLFAEVFSRGKLPASTVQTECSHEMESRCAFNAESPKTSPPFGRALSLRTFWPPPPKRVWVPFQKLLRSPPEAMALGTLRASVNRTRGPSQKKEHYDVSERCQADRQPRQRC